MYQNQTNNDGTQVHKLITGNGKVQTEYLVYRFINLFIVFRQTYEKRIFKTGYLQILNG